MVGFRNWWIVTFQSASTRCAFALKSECGLPIRRCQMADLASGNTVSWYCPVLFGAADRSSLRFFRFNLCYIEPEAGFVIRLLIESLFRSGQKMFMN